MPELFLDRRQKVARKKNSTGIRLQILFKENMKILTETLTVMIYPKNYLRFTYRSTNIENQKPTPKLQTSHELKCLKTLWELTLHKYLTSIYLCWEFGLPTSTLLSISGHFNANLDGSKGIFTPSLDFSLTSRKQ